LLDRTITPGRGARPGQVGRAWKTPPVADPDADGEQPRDLPDGTWVAPAAPVRTPPPARVLPFLVLPIIGLIVATNIGHALSPTLITEKPALMLALNSQNRYLLLAGQNLDNPAYFGIAMPRLLIADPFFYLLGYWYGDRALRWIETKSPTYGTSIRYLEKAFAKASWPLVVALPNNPVCLLAGTARMAPALFIVLNLVGTFGRLVIIRILGDIFSGPVDWLLGVITTYRIPLTIISVAVVAFIVLNDWRSGRGQIEQLLDLEHDLEHDLELEQGLESNGGSGTAADDDRRDP
jgi:membrane protein DedA with SNARE-associated domain